MPSPSGSKKPVLAPKKLRSAGVNSGLVFAFGISSVPASWPKLLGFSASGACWKAFSFFV
jgi:hypothetical protein